MTDEQMNRLIHEEIMDRKQLLDLAILLYRDLPFWKRWSIQNHLGKGTTANRAWKRCVKNAYYMLRDARATSWCEYFDPLYTPADAEK